MARRPTIQYEVLSPDLVNEVQQVLPMLAGDGHVTVSISSELARVVEKLLRAAERGAVAFEPVSPKSALNCSPRKR